MFLIYLFFFKKKVVSTNQNKKNNFKTDSQTMVECARCGTFVSVKESIIKDGKFYCSSECANDTSRA